MEVKSKAGDLSDSITEYIQTYYKLTLLNAADKATTIAASTLASVVALVLGFFVILFGGIALAMWLGSLLDNPALGFVLVAGFFLLVIIIIVALKKKIVFPAIRDNLINKLYEPNDQNVQRSV
ncbi:MAG: phage holin family protein [Chitinophagaceae bacterium]|nr:MAG: phage holin family protein [Chitinophagaceae bacterium]